MRWPYWRDRTGWRRPGGGGLVRRLFPGRYYIELQENTIPEQGIANERLLEIARELDLPLVATNDCHYLNREDAKAHEVLLCIQTGKTMNDPNRMHFPPQEFYVKSPGGDGGRLSTTPPRPLPIPWRLPSAAISSSHFKTYHFPQFDNAGRTRSSTNAWQRGARRASKSASPIIRACQPGLHRRSRKQVYRDRLAASSSTASSRWASPAIS